MVKPLQGNIHEPSQHGHLEQFINEKEKYYRDIYKRVSRNQSLENHPPTLYINIMDQSSVKPWINVVIKFEENIIHQITLCQEHSMTLRLPNY